MKKLFIGAGLFVLLLLSGYFVYLALDSNVDQVEDALVAVENPNAEPPMVEMITRPEVVTVDISFFGDIFWGRRMQTWSEESKLGAAYPFSGLDTFNKQSGENWVGNLECPVTDKEVSQVDQETILKFNCRKEYLPFTSEYFDVFSLSNNHTDNVDGQWGLDQTRINLDQEGIQYFGHYDHAVKEDICEVVAMNGVVDGERENVVEIPVALCGYHSVFKLPLQDEIDVISQFAEVLPTFVMPHQGAEYINAADSFQISVFRSMIDSGADAVIGGHTHSVINTEVYNDRLIAYSIGNFIFDQQGSEMVESGLVVDATIKFEYDDVLKFIGLDCGNYKDNCIDTLAGEAKPEFSIAYDARVSNSGERLTKLAGEAHTKRVLERANWEETKVNLFDNTQ